VAGQARAQDVTLAFTDGRVTLRARDATARQILAEWARQTEVRILGAERLAGPPLTLQLEEVPETEALDVVLRQASGYILAPRPVGAAGTTAIDRIFILPVSTASAAALPPPRAAGPPAFAPPPVLNDPALPQNPLGQDGSAPPDGGESAEPVSPGDPAPLTPATAPEAFAQPPGPAPLPSFAAPSITDTQTTEEDAPTPLIVPRPGVLPAPRPQPQPPSPPDPQRR